MRKVGEYDMFEPVQLLLYSGVYHGMAMAEKVAPPRADDVDIFFAVIAVEVYAASLLYRDGGKFLVVLHL